MAPALPPDEVVDQAARDAERRRDVGQGVGGEPPGLVQLQAVGDGLARAPVRREAQHQGRGEGPGLASEVADAADLYPDLLADLADHRLLQALPRLDEPRKDAVSLCGHAPVVRQKKPSVPFHGDDDRRVQGGVEDPAAARATQAPVLLSGPQQRGAGRAEAHGTAPVHVLIGRAGAGKGLLPETVPYGAQVQPLRPPRLEVLPDLAPGGQVLPGFWKMGVKS